MSADEWVMQLQADRRARLRGCARSSCARRASAVSARRPPAESDRITIQGEDLAELNRLGRRRRAISSTACRAGEPPAVDRGGEPAAGGSPRPRACRDLGLDVAEVGQTLRTALDGTIATRYAEGNLEYDVRVMLPREQFTTLGGPRDRRALPGSADGAPIYLRDVATVNSGLGPTSILAGAAEPDHPGERRHPHRGRLARSRQRLGRGAPGGIRAARRIRHRDGRRGRGDPRNNRQLLIVILLAIFMVFVVLAIQYESITDPLVILLAIPLSLIGVGLGLWVTQTPQSAPVLLGVILLAGIVVNNSILLVEYANQNRRERGMELEEAVIRAGVVRLRPILMTTLCTVFGTLPLALGLGEGSELMQPLAIAVVSGMFFSMALSMLVVPGAYVGVNRFRAAQGGVVGRRKSPRRREELELASARYSLDTPRRLDSAEPGRQNAVPLVDVEPDVRDVPVCHRGSRALHSARDPARERAASSDRHAENPPTPRSRRG